MTIQSILNLIGLIINMVGAYMMYHYAPNVDSRTILYKDTEEMMQVMKKDKFKNNMARYGMLFLFAGFLFQLVAAFWPAK